MSLGRARGVDGAAHGRSAPLGRARARPSHTQPQHTCPQVHPGCGRVPALLAQQVRVPAYVQRVGVAAQPPHRVEGGPGHCWHRQQRQHAHDRGASAGVACIVGALGVQQGGGCSTSPPPFSERRAPRVGQRRSLGRAAGPHPPTATPLPPPHTHRSRRRRSLGWACPSGTTGGRLGGVCACVLVWGWK